MKTRFVRVVVAVILLPAGLAAQAIEPVVPMIVAQPAEMFPAPASVREAGSIDVMVEPRDPRFGEVVRIIAIAKPAKGWHIYSTTTKDGFPTTLDFSNPFLREVSPFTAVESDAMKIEEDSELPGWKAQYFEKTVHFVAAFEIKENAPEAFSVSGAVRAQFCRESCIQQERRFSADVTRAVGPARGQYLPNAPFEAVTRGADRRFWPFVLAAVLAALGALASGCVFPMIPLTITFFTKRAEENRARQVRYAAAYGGGIIFSFTVIGLVIAAIAGASGLNRLASNPWVNVGIGALFVLFGLSLLEIVNARMPSWLVRRVAGASGAARPGYLPVVMMGLLFTLTTFTCTFPFVGMLLVLAASGQWFWPALGMIVFSFTFAFPFFFLALFPGYLGRLPQAGQWMHRVKIAMSLVVMAFAFKFFCAADLVRGWGIFTRSVVLAVWCAMAIAEGLLLLGAIAIGEKRREEVGSGSLLSGVAFLALAAYLGSGLCGGRLHGVVEGFLPPCPEAAVAAPAKVDTGGTKAANVAGRDAVDTSAWFSDYVQAMRAAAGAGRNVFVNFTGITCVACRRMENTVFLDPQVRMVLEELVRAKLYVDLGTPESGRNAALQAEKFGSVALPLYAIVRPSDGTVLAILQGGDHTAEEFVEFLARGL